MSPKLSRLIFSTLALLALVTAAVTAEPNLQGPSIKDILAPIPTQTVRDDALQIAQTEPKKWQIDMVVKLGTETQAFDYNGRYDTEEACQADMKSEEFQLSVVGFAMVVYSLLGPEASMSEPKCNLPGVSGDPV